MKENTYALARNVLRIYEPPYTLFLQAGRHSGLFDVHNLFWALFWCTCIQSRGRLSQISYPFNIATRNKHITFLWDLEMHTCIIWCSLLSDTVPSKLSGECGLLKPCLRCCTTLRCLYFQLYCARTSFWFIFFSLSLFFKITFLSELKIAYWICLTTYFQL